MITIYDRIKTIAESMVTADNFHYGRKSDINIQGDNAAFPAIILIEPDDIGFNFNIGTGNIKDTDSVFIQFVDIVEMGDQAKDRITVVQAMRTLAAQFVDLVVNDDIIEIATSVQLGLINIKGTLVVDMYDVNVAGIEINIPLRLVYPRGCSS